MADGPDRETAEQIVAADKAPRPPASKSPISTPNPARQAVLVAKKSWASAKSTVTATTAKKEELAKKMVEIEAMIPGEEKAQRINQIEQQQTEANA